MPSDRFVLNYESILKYKTLYSSLVTSTTTNRLVVYSVDQCLCHSPYVSHNYPYTVFKYVLKYRVYNLKMNVLLVIWGEYQQTAVFTCCTDAE